MKNLKYKVIDLTSITKFNLRNQVIESDIDLIIRNISKSIGPTHIGIAIPMDEDIEGSYPLKPREYTQLWIDTIRDYGMNVLHKPNICSLEGLYGYEKNVGSARTMPFVWVEIMEKYIKDNKSFFEDGDIWAPFPVMTDGLHYTEDTSWLPWRDGVSGQYARFYTSIQETSKKSFEELRVGVELGFSSHPIAEASGFIQQSVFDQAGIVSVETFGIDTSVVKLQNMLDEVIKKRKLPLFLSWGDKWTKLLKPEVRLEYYKNIYTLFSIYADLEKMIGFSFYCEAPGESGSIIKEDFSINKHGKILGNFFHDEKEEEPKFEGYLYYPEGEVVADIPCNMRGILAVVTIQTPLGGDLIFYDDNKEIARFNQRSATNSYTVMAPFRIRLRVEKKNKKGSFSILPIQNFTS